MEVEVGPSWVWDILCPRLFPPGDVVATAVVSGLFVLTRQTWSGGGWQTPHLAGQRPPCCLARGQERPLPFHHCPGPVAVHSWGLSGSSTESSKEIWELGDLCIYFEDFSGNTSSCCYFLGRAWHPCLFQKSGPIFSVPVLLPASALLLSPG